MEDKWYMVVGNSTKDNIGRVILYTSPDLRKWDYVGVLATSKCELGYMWECPDFFKLGDKYVLSFSPQGIEKKDGKYPNLFQTGYIVGDYDYDKNEFKHGDFYEFDNGHDFYAVQTFLDDKGRRIAIGWMDMWESHMPTKEDGWCGALTMPRELTLGDDNKIKMNPIEEIELLREECISSEENVIVSENNSFKIKTSEKMLVIDVTFDILNSDSKELGLKINGSDEEELVLKYDTDASQLTIDCSKYGKEQDSTRKADVSKNSKLSLRVFLDRSSIEVFINDGEAVITSRIYPQKNIDNIEFFTSNGEVKIESLKAWKYKQSIQ